MNKEHIILFENECFLITRYIFYSVSEWNIMSSQLIHIASCGESNEIDSLLIPRPGSCNSTKSIFHSCHSIRRGFWLFDLAMVRTSDSHRGTEIEHQRECSLVNETISIWYKRKPKPTNFSSGSSFKYLWINRMTQLSCFSWSTVHFRFFIIGTFPVAFSSISTEEKLIPIYCCLCPNKIC